MSEFIEWSGGKCPLKPGTPHIQRCRDGKEWPVHRAWAFKDINWRHDGTADDIIAFRVDGNARETWGAAMALTANSAIIVAGLAVVTLGSMALFAD